MVWLHRQKVLHGIQLILIGDFNQCSIDPFMKTFDDHPLFGLLCDWNRVEMLINKRERMVAGQPTVHALAERLLEGKPITGAVRRHEVTDNNLCWSHDTRVMVNKQVHDAKLQQLPTGAERLSVVLEREPVELFIGARLVCRRPRSGAAANSDARIRLTAEAANWAVSRARGSASM